MENDMKSKFLREIRANLEYMSTLERRIAETILSEPKNAVKSSLSKLSEQANVSQGSFANFANKFFGGGFSAMKLEIVSSLSDDEKQPYSAVAGTDSMGDILKKTVGSISDALTNTSALNDEKYGRRCGKSDICQRSNNYWLEQSYPRLVWCHYCPAV
jgi:DNA-binding MurR/RpiR family transcriptional regulator